jgi:uncharacterized protein (TIGR02271 family)
LWDGAAGRLGVTTQSEGKEQEGDRQMADIDTVRSWRGKTMVDRDGDKIGTIEDIYADDRTGQPEWALVNSGLFGTKSTFVPLAQATERDGDKVQVPYEKALVKDAPGIEADQHLSEAEEQQLWRHYGLDYDYGAGYGTDYQSTDRAAEAGTDAGGYDRTAAGGDDAMTRSEEALQVGTEMRERGRVRLRKYVTTEQVTQTVPVQREEARVEREPISNANIDAAMAGPDISEAEHEVVLHEEQPVVEKRTVPRERVRLEKDTVTGEEQVAEEVRKEQIDLDDQSGRGGRRDQ